MRKLERVVVPIKIGINVTDLQEFKG